MKALRIAGLETHCALCDRPWDSLGRLPDRTIHGRSVHDECAAGAIYFALELADDLKRLEGTLAAVIHENRRTSQLRRVA